VLDGYSEERCIAFEYHGAQHFKQVEAFHRQGSRTLEQQQSRDELVRRACLAQGVVLIEVPTIPSGYSDDDLISAVDAALHASTGIRISADVKTAFVYSAKGVQRLKRVQAVANEKGGRCLETSWTTSSSPMLWECADGHVWRASASSILSGSWCGVCAGTQLEDGLKIAAEAAAEKSLTLTSTEYVVGQPLRLTCAIGHQFTSLLKALRKNKKPCPDCAPRRRTDLLDIARRLAQTRGGHVVSDEISNVMSSVRWRCEQGHAWNATFVSVERGSWCRCCAGTKAVDPMGDVRRIAKESGGGVLSEDAELRNSATPVRLHCTLGHIFERSRKELLKGRWCQVCASGDQAARDKELLDLVSAKGGQVLGFESSEAQRRKLRLKCGLGHKWLTTRHQLVTLGQWCAICMGRKLEDPMAELHAIASSRGGRVIECDYKNNKSPLRLVCVLGHEWMSTANRLKLGSWCGSCTKREAWVRRKASGHEKSSVLR
jgi:hypothetical protein